MASFKDGMRTHVASSMSDRFMVNQPAAEGGSRPALQRQAEGRGRLEGACVLRLDRIEADPNQPRKEFDPHDLADLASSLKERGQLQPIRVRWDETSSRYVVVVGERRWRAAQLSGLETIACVVVSGQADPEDLLEDQLVENALRADLKPVEQARAYQSLLSARNLTHRELADRLRIGHASITRALATLDLPEWVQEEVDAGRIAANTAYELSKVEDAAEQETLAKAAAKGLLRREDLQERSRQTRSANTSKSSRRTRTAKMTRRLFRTAAGRITVENGRGLDLDVVIKSLLEVVDQLRIEQEGRAGEDEAGQTKVA